MLVSCVPIKSAGGGWVRLISDVYGTSVTHAGRVDDVTDTGF